jgi:putative transposase
VGEQRG